MTATEVVVTDAIAPEVVGAASTATTRAVASIGTTPAVAVVVAAVAAVEVSGIEATRKEVCSAFCISIKKFIQI